MPLNYKVVCSRQYDDKLANSFKQVCWRIQSEESTLRHRITGPSMAAIPVTSGQSDSWPQHSCQRELGSRSSTQSAGLESVPNLNFFKAPCCGSLDKMSHQSSIVNVGLQVLVHQKWSRKDSENWPSSGTWGKMTLVLETQDQHYKHMHITWKDLLAEKKKLQKLWRARQFSLCRLLTSISGLSYVIFFLLLFLDQRLYNRFNYIIIGQSSKEEENQNIILPLTVAMNSL